MRYSVTLAARAMIVVLGAACCASAGARAADQPRRPPEQIRGEVEGLWKKDVAWRGVSWRTCLLEGLRESRRVGKPLILWVFIDRPIDDERC